MNQRSWWNHAGGSASPRTWQRRIWPAALLTGTLSGCVTEEIAMPERLLGNGPPQTLAVRPAAWTTSSAPTAAGQPRSVQTALAPIMSSDLLAQRPAPARATGPETAPDGTKSDTEVKTAASAPASTSAPAPAPASDVAVKPATSVDPSIQPAVSPPVVPPPALEYPIDLTTALRLAEIENPEIAVTRQRIAEAAALRQAAMVLLLPNLNAGTNYHGHTGNLQRSSGRILALSEQSIYYGGGARTLAAESLAIPAVNVTTPLADALYEPLAARQNLERAQFDSRATANSILLEVATAYFDLVQAEASLQLRRETEAEAAEISRLTRVYAETGQGRKADANRGATRLQLIHREVQQGEEEVAVASARLAHRLHLDQTIRIHPVVTAIAPFALVDLSTPTDVLVRTALQRRPEMGARSAEIAAAQTRLSEELARPLLPFVWLGFSGGGFAGGSNLVPPFIGNNKGRTDFDVRIFWTLQNLGFGNLSIQRRRRAQIGEAMGEQSRAVNLIRDQVASARAEAIAATEQIEVTRRQLDTAIAGFREDLDRIRGTVGLPIEVENSMELVNQARQNHLRAIITSNQAQLRLFVALGSPPPLERPATAPLPPAPIAAPPLPVPLLATTPPPPPEMPPPRESPPSPVVTALAPPDRPPSPATNTSRSSPSQITR